MGRRVAWIALLVAGLAVPARADEADDLLTRELVLVVRDPLAPVPARVQAARTLGRLGPKAKSAVPELTRLIARSRYAELLPLQEAMIDALGQIGAAARPAVPALTREAGRNIDVDLAVARAVDQIMQAAEEADLPTLLRQLQHRDESLRLRAAKALGKLGPAAKSALPHLTAALGDEDADVRHAALAALRLVQPSVRPGDAEANALARDLQDPDPANRLRAVKSLAGLGNAAGPAAAALESLLDDKDPDVRRAASEALGRLGPR
jgi:HEAT repeat protein